MFNELEGISSLLNRGAGSTFLQAVQDDSNVLDALASLQWNTMSGF
jgi:hypothetical protein